MLVQRKLQQMTPRKKITYIHNTNPNESTTETTTYYTSVEEFTTAMQRRKEKLYPHLETEIVDVEDVVIDPYASAFKEDSRYRYNG
jgi:hypothetical protein